MLQCQRYMDAPFSKPVADTLITERESLAEIVESIFWNESPQSKRWRHPKDHGSWETLPKIWRIFWSVQQRLFEIQIGRHVRQGDI